MSAGFSNNATSTTLYDPWIVVVPRPVTASTVATFVYSNDPFYPHEARRERHWAEDAQAQHERLHRLVEEFGQEVETEAARRLRVSREMNRQHIRESRRFAPPPLPEALFDRPTFARRACGGRWRVMMA